MISRLRLLTSSLAVAALGVPLLTELADAATGAAPADLQILNAGIELERAGIQAYTSALATGLLSAKVAGIATRFRGDHLAHRDALIGAVRAGGGTVSTATAKITYPALHDERDIIVFAKTVEELAASTYLSVIPELQSRPLAGVTASILGIETTHVALLAYALGEPAYPGAFVPGAQ